MAVVRGAYPADGEDIFLDVTVKDGFLAEGRWMTTVMVKCSRRGNRPAQRIPLTVRLDGRDYGATGAETDEQGVFNQYVGLPGPNPAGYFLSAQIPGTTVEAGEWVKAKADAPAKPEDPALAGARRCVELGKLATEDLKLVQERRLLRAPKPEDPTLAKAKRTVELGRLVVEGAKIAQERRSLRAPKSAAEVRLGETNTAVAQARAEKELRELAPTSKPLGQPAASAAGGQGKYLISIHVPYEDGSPAKDVPVRLIVTKLGAEPKVVDLKTDANGFAVDEEADLPYRLEFTEPRCSVAVQVAGREIVLKNLAGPPQEATDAAAADTAATLPRSPADADRDARTKARAAGTKFAENFLAGWRGETPAAATDAQPGRVRRFFYRLGQLTKRRER